MPEPVSVTVGVCCLGYATLGAYARFGSAISPEAAAAQQSASAVIKSVERSHALFGGKSAAISTLMSMAEECSEPGWDGDAAGIDPMAVAKAADFVRALPDDLPLPDFAPEPDGSVSLDWMESRHRLFSISIGAGDRLAYAWLDGADKGHGVARFDGSSVPPRILEGIRSIAGHVTGTAVRIA
jgi:hypothetical protein